jgi:hypothetical protein
LKNQRNLLQIKGDLLMKNSVLGLLFLVLAACEPAFANIKSSQGVDAYLFAPKTNTFSVSSPSFTPAATPTDVCSINGGAKKILRVLHIRVTSQQTTAGVNFWQVVKRSAFDTAGTMVPMTIVPHDSFFTATVAAAQYMTTSNPTLGTSVGTVRAAYVVTPQSTTATGPTFVQDFDFSPTTGASAMIIHPTESIALNFNGAAVPAGFVMNCEFTWQEEN